MKISFLFPLRRFTLFFIYKRGICKETGMRWIVYFEYIGLKNFGFEQYFRKDGHYALLAVAKLLSNLGNNRLVRSFSYT